MTTASATPMIGVPSGATIIAPITVAVELARTPAVAMIAASASKIQNLDSLRRTSPRYRNSPSCSSGKVRRTPTTQSGSALEAPSEAPPFSSAMPRPLCRLQVRGSSLCARNLRAPGTR